MGRTVAVKAKDAKSAVEGGKFKPYPEGEYIAEIIDVEEPEGGIKSGQNRGKPTLKVTMRFTDENEVGAGKKYIEWGVPLFTEWASGKSAFLFYQFFKAVGVEFPEDGDVDLPDNDELLGEEIGVRLTVQDSNKLDPDFPPEDEVYLKQNRTGGFFPASRGIKSPPKADSGSSEPTEKDFDL